MKTNTIKNDFSNGEVSPVFVGREDLPVYKAVVEWMENFIALSQGPTTFRQGTKYVHHTRLNRFAVLIPFQYSDIQAYLIEATDQKFRFYRNEGIAVAANVTISGISNTNPAVVSSTAHGYSNGDEVFINEVEGMAEINGTSYIVAGAATNSYQLRDVFGNNVSAISFGAYTGGGISQKIYEIDTPYTEAYLRYLNHAQDADLMYLVNRTFEPRKLIRTGDTNWSLSTYARTADPFTGAGAWPGAVTFTTDGAIVFGGTDNKAETIFKSRTPIATGPRYDNFDLGGSSPTASHAAIFKLAPLHGKVDSIRWLSNTDKFVVAGTFGSVRRIYGAREDLPFTPLDINARSVNAYGVAPISPVPNGTNLLYTSRSGNILRSVEYDYQIDGYQSLDKNLISGHILRPEITHICNQAGNPEILWSVRSDGALIGLTYNDKENKYGWHKHRIAGGTVEWAETMPRENSIDQLWIVVKRTINGQTVRYVEFIADAPQWPLRLDFRTGKLNEAPDTRRYLNALFEKQKRAIHVDAAIVYDGSVYGTSADATLTPWPTAITVGETEVLFETDNAVFTASMVGRQLWKKYATDGTGGGRARIDSFNSSTSVECTILSAFDNVEDIVPGEWFLTASTISGIHHLEGENVTVLNDGALSSPDNVGTYKVVANGQINLNKQASIIIIGLPYTGIIQGVPLDQGGQSGPAVSKIKNVKQLIFRFLNTLGISFGTDVYNTDKMDFVSTGQITDRPPPLFTGVKDQTYEDTHDRDKRFVIVQDTPFPCTILSVEPYVVTTERG